MSSMSSEPSEIAVTLICASEHEPTLSGLIRRLEAAGFSLRVIFDGQREPDRIAEVIDELDDLGERGLFVLCESGHADELGFRRIESTLAAALGYVVTAARAFDARAPAGEQRVVDLDAHRLQHRAGAGKEQVAAHQTTRVVEGQGVLGVQFSVSGAIHTPRWARSDIAPTACALWP